MSTAIIAMEFSLLFHSFGCAALGALGAWAYCSLRARDNAVRGLVDDILIADDHGAVQWCMPEPDLFGAGLPCGDICWFYACGGRCYIIYGRGGRYRVRIPAGLYRCVQERALRGVEHQAQEGGRHE